MSNLNEDSLHAPNPDHNVNPTSEVGSVPVITVQELRSIMRELIQSLVQKSNAGTKNLPLPRFNPDTMGFGPAAWCAADNLIMEENPLQISALNIISITSDESTST